MSSSKVLFYSCLFFLFGTALSFFFRLPLSFLIFVFSLSLLLSLHQKKLFPFTFFAFAFLGGVLNAQYFLFQFQSSPLKNFEKKTVLLKGEVIAEPKIKENFQIIKVRLENNLGNLLVYLPKSFSLEVGDKIEFAGKLRRAPPYYLKDRVGFLISFPRIEKIEKGRFSLRKFLFLVKQKSEQKILRIFGREEGALLVALLDGEEKYFQKEELEKLNLSGTRHICAVSGMNITILSSILLHFFLFLGFSRKSSFFSSLFLISFYILLIGAPSSGVRAAIMSFLANLGYLLGRKSSGNLILVLTAATMVLLNPAILVYDVGFQLSFLAMLGIVNLEEFFKLIFQKVPNLLSLRVNLATTLAAQFFTFPLLLYQFGNLSLISPISNLLVLPFLPSITILGIAFLFFSFLNPLAQIFFFFLSPFLNYLLVIVDLFAKVPVLKISHLDVTFLLLYLPLIWFVKQAKEYTKLKFLQIW